MFLVGLDVIREYGMVIDDHHNRGYSHILKRYIPCAISPNGASCSGDDDEQKRIRTEPSVESCALIDSALGPTTKGTGEKNACA